MKVEKQYHCYLSLYHCEVPSNVWIYRVYRQQNLEGKSWVMRDFYFFWIYQASGLKKYGFLNDLKLIQEPSCTQQQEARPNKTSLRIIQLCENNFHLSINFFITSYLLPKMRGTFCISTKIRNHGLPKKMFSFLWHRHWCYMISLKFISTFYEWIIMIQKQIHEKTNLVVLSRCNAYFFEFFISTTKNNKKKPMRYQN